MPQHALAKRVSLDASLISMLESGKRKPSLETLERISEALGIPFHLFTLLAAEGEDFKSGEAKSFEELAVALARLLLSPEGREPNSHGSVNRQAGYSERKSSRRNSQKAKRRTG